MKKTKICDCDLIDCRCEEKIKIMKIKIPEHEIQKTVLEYLGYQKDIYFFRAGSGAIKTDTGRYFKTGKAGCPDVVCCINGTFVGLEIKTDKGKLSPAQQEAKQQIEKAGGLYIVIRDIKDLDHLIFNTSKKYE